MKTTTEKTKTSGRQLLTEQIEEQLLHYIQNEPLQVGQKIPNEFELAQRFQVGRSTIREVIRSLATQGVLEVRRGSGTYVSSLEPIQEDPLGLNQIEDEWARALDLLEVRLMLEPELAACAAQKATDTDKLALTRLCDQIEALNPASTEYANKEMEFHIQLAKASKNQVAEKLVPVLTSGIIKLLSLTGPLFYNGMEDPHRMICDAILEGDGQSARYTVIAYLSNRRQALKQKIAKRSSLV